MTKNAFTPDRIGQTVGNKQGDGGVALNMLRDHVVPMPGCPKFRELSRRIEKAGGAEHVFDRIANGEYVTRIAASFDVSPASIYKWIHQSEEREKAWEAAKEVSAHTHVEGGLERLERLADDPSATREQIMAEKALAEYRWKVAAARNRQAYGEGQRVALQVNVGSLHLEALQARGHMDSVRAPTEPPMIEADYTVEE